MSLSGRYFTSAQGAVGDAETRRLELRGQLAACPQIPPMASEHALEQAIELGHGGAERLDGDGAEIELLRHQHPARLGPGRHLLQGRHGVLHMHEEEAAEGEIERRAGHGVEREHVGFDQVELRAALRAELGERLGGKLAIDL